MIRSMVRNWVLAIATASLAGISAMAIQPVSPASAQSSPAPASPQSSPAPASPSARPRTEFFCNPYESSFVTLARRGPTVTPPMIRWTTTLGEYSPQERCNIVTQRLNRVVASRGGTMGGLMLTYGPVLGSKVICYVGALNESCTQDNILFTLRPGDDPKVVLRRMVAFSVLGSGSPVQQSSSGRDFARLGDRVETCLRTPARCTQNSSTVPEGI